MKETFALDAIMLMAYCAAHLRLAVKLLEANGARVSKASGNATIWRCDDMNINSRIFVALGLCFLILAASDHFISPVANPQSRLLGGVLWRLQQVFGSSASWLALLGVGILLLALAVIESRRNKNVCVDSKR